MSKSRISVSAGSCVLLALMLLVLPIQWIFAAATAAMVHELCHIAAVYLCGGRIRSFSLGASGAVMWADAMSPGKQLFCALAGPIGALPLVLLLPHMPRLAICAAVHSLYNLLPVYPLDGGHALQCILSLILPRHAPKLCSFIQLGCCIVIAALGIYACFFLGLGIYALVPALMLLLRKSPCKPVPLGLQ